jgi:penicillin-binding protein 2
MAFLALAFFRVQVLASDAYKLRAESNRLRPLTVPAPRGTVFDREGRVIADNVPGYAVSVLPSPRDSIRATLERMAPLLELSDRAVERLAARRDQAPLQPLTVTTDASFEAVSALEERRHQFPNVWVEMRPKRRYVAGPAVSHLMGYIGEITADELESPRFLDEGEYEQGMIVGKTGLEREYEEGLQGNRGTRYVEVDAAGRIVGDFAGITSRPAEPGQDIRLNIDLELQEWIHRIFPDTMTGAVVALDPADGGVLALYSAPTFDPNAFVGGIDEETWAGLNTDETKPLYNRAVLGTYAPASTWKVASAAIALDLGVVTPYETMPEPCDGTFRYGGRTWRCWDPAGHGDVNLVEALQHSCNVYFYQLGLRVGLDRLLQRSTEVGFSRRCGIDLPQESAGQFPADRDYWTRQYGYRAREGEVLSLAIGQGANDQTPLKMAQFYVAVARDGTAPAPLLRRDRADAAPGGWSLDLSHAALEAIREGTRRVVGEGGTAYLSSLEAWDLMGKTGSGQNNLSLQGLADSHAWFAGMAGPPGGDPEIVVVALVEYGGGGSAVAAPLVAKTADFYLRKKHGLPVDTVQTLREHLLTGTRWEPVDREPAGEGEPTGAAGAPDLP